MQAEGRGFVRGKQGGVPRDKSGEGERDITRRHGNLLRIERYIFVQPSVINRMEIYA
jgi:hypothetical protein